MTLQSGPVDPVPPPPPPGLAPPPPPPGLTGSGGPPRRSFPWLGLLLGFLLLGSVLVNLVLGVALAARGVDLSEDPTQGYQEVLVDGERDAESKIVLIPIKGTIMDSFDSSGGSLGTCAQIRALLKCVRKDKAVKAIVLEVNSPGGGVTESDRIYHELKTFREDTGLPIVALFGDVAASGGYYVSMASDHIMAHPTTVTGSIGVIAQFFEMEGLMGKIGLNVETIKSLRFDKTESFKDIGSPYRKMRPAERELLQNLITEMWNRFVEVVAEGRKGKLTLEQIKPLADGRIFTGPQAVELKLIDSIGYQEDAFKKARELGKAGKAKVIRYRREPSLRDLLAGPTAESRPPDLDAVLERFTAGSPRLMYLWNP